MENLYVFISKETLYLGLKNGENYARPYWTGELDSSLQRKIDIKVINITNTETLEDKDYVIVENDRLIGLDKENELYNYFMNK